MAQVREPAVAGQFYTKNKEELLIKLKDYFDKAEKHKTDINARIALTPHAGYPFSGQIAADAINQLDKENINKVFILASAHHANFDGVSVFDGNYYQTPLGLAPLDTTIINKLIKNNDFIDFVASAHKNEHCIEVEIPFVQHYFNDAKIIPLLIGSYNKSITKELAYALQPWKNDDSAAFIISTDFSHYPDYETAKKIDKETAEAITTGDPEKLTKIIKKHENENIPSLATDLCGWTSVLTVMNLFNNEDIKWENISYANSGDSPYGDHDRVVGYNAIVAGPQKKNDQSFRLEEKEKEYLLNLARKTLVNHFSGDDFKINPELKYYDNLKEECGAFVTLKKNGKLRGCIGNFSANEPLYKIVEKMAISAAFNDPRFPSLREEELDDINIEISVLTPMQPMNDTSELILGKHGIYIKDGMNSGTFLPQVAEDTGWSKEEFLGHCARDKAGIGWNGWKSAEVFLYEALVFKENE